MTSVPIDVAKVVELVDQINEARRLFEQAVIERDSLREQLAAARALLHRFEVSANTVDCCYTKLPENFASALRDLRECADAALKSAP